MNAYLESNKAEACCGCGACTSVCPTSCIEMQEDRDGFLFPVLISADKCINCNLCKKVCPIEHPFKNEGGLQAFGAYSVDDEMLKSCSSGGIFPELSDYVLNEGGCVYGAVFDDNWNLHHDRASNLEELKRQYGSKYVQSCIGGCYSDCKESLEKGQLVLFTGTPCQIAGLRNFLRKEYDTLFTLDVICHGVPSTKMFHAYLSTLEKKHGGNICEVVFRDKSKNGWSITLKYSIKKKNGKINSYFYKSSDSSYFSAFLKGMIARESCYHCPFSTLSRPGDLTLGDFWGYQKTRPELKNHMGLSLVLCNSPKGEQLLDILRERNVFFAEVTQDSIRQSENKNLFYPTKRNNTRDVIYEELERQGYRYLEKHLIPVRKKSVVIKEKIRRYLSNLIHRNGK